MPKYNFSILLDIAGVESEINATAVYDYARADNIVDIYDVYCDNGGPTYLYVGNYLTNAQYDALEAEILAAMSYYKEV